MVYAWPEAEIGMMDANQAAKIMYADADAATIRAKAAEYKNLQSSPLSAAKSEEKNKRITLCACRNALLYRLRK